jgi:hypothetical protein
MLPAHSPRRFVWATQPPEGCVSVLARVLEGPQNHGTAQACYSYSMIHSYRATQTTCIKSDLSMKPCSLLKDNRRFGVIYRLHLQGFKSKPRKALLAVCLIPVPCLVYSTTLKMVIYSSETSALYPNINPAVRTSNPTMSRV